MEEKAYLKVDDEPLKLEYKIEEKEKALKEINDKIKFAESVDNQQELFTLRVKKQRLDLELRFVQGIFSSGFTVKDFRRG